MFVLEWYVYLIIAVTVFGSMTLAYRYEEWRENRSCPDTDPHPCLSAMGVDEAGIGYWCWKPHGHDGAHGWMTYGELAVPGDESPSICFRSSNCVSEDGHTGDCDLQH